MKIFDLHIDLAPFCLTAGRTDIKNKNKIGNFFLPDQVDMPRLREGEVKIFLANICPIIATENGFELPQNNMDETMRQLNFYKNLDKTGQIKLVKKNKDYEGNKLSALLSIEGAYFIEKKRDLELLTNLKKEGVISIAPTWNINNKLGTGAGDVNAEMGLTKLGVEFIEVCEQNNIVIDAVHASKKTFFDIVKFSKKPFFVSHAACFGITNHRRNLNDDQIKIVAERGGIIGISFIKNFIGQDSIGGVIIHLKHLIKVAGENHVAIGSDFDGMEHKDIIKGLEDISKMQNFIKECMQNGISEKLMQKITYENAKCFFENI